MNELIQQKQPAWSLSNRIVFTETQNATEPAVII